MAYNDDNEAICHFCGLVVYTDELGEYLQMGYAWMTQMGWDTTSNYAGDIQWIETFAHKTCFRDYIAMRKEHASI